MHKNPLVVTSIKTVFEEQELKTHSLWKLPAWKTVDVSCPKKVNFQEKNNSFQTEQKHFLSGVLLISATSILRDSEVDVSEIAYAKTQRKNIVWKNIRILNELTH